MWDCVCSLVPLTPKDLGLRGGPEENIGMAPEPREQYLEQKINEVSSCPQ